MKSAIAFTTALILDAQAVKLNLPPQFDYWNNYTRCNMYRNRDRFASIGSGFWECIDTINTRALTYGSVSASDC